MNDILYHAKPHTPSHGGHVILIVDDEQQIGTALEKFFRFAGLETVSTTNGSEALSMLHVRKPQLIILDLKMPILDGMTLLKAIRSDKTFKSVPIVIYTSDFSQEKETEAVAAGAQAFIVKGTVGWDALLERIRELLGDRRPPLRLAD